ncbi:MAG: Rpn family recombination-promoting nuclease/putative transposase [Pyrinomonadaceae bacterium]|nr:Rpn family recombination-promoting nuclease/putative transposase [Pyrinomonadaceae bacterium]
MSESANPHDRFFKESMSDLETAAEFLALYLPLDVAELLDFSILEQINESFVDEELKTHFSDLLFRVNLKSSSSAYIYILLEHKSVPDEWVALQINRYLSKIWERARRSNAKKLPIVVPVVFYHGAKRWTISNKFSALFDFDENTTVLRDFVPQFRYHLCDLSIREDETLQGRPHLQAILRLLKHINLPDLNEQLLEIFRLAIIEGKREGKTLDALKTIVRYLALTKRASKQVVKENFNNPMATQNFYPEVRTFIDDWIDEGLEKGLQQGKVEQTASLNLRLLRRILGELSTVNEEKIRSLTFDKAELLSDSLLDFRSTEDLDKWLVENVENDLSLKG